MNVKKILIAIMILLIPALCFAELSPKLKEYKRIIEESGERVRTTGDILEILVRNTFFKRNPGDDVLGNIMYIYHGRVIGELDMMYSATPWFAPSGDHIIIVAEMKLWRDAKRALAKAKKQLLRYQSHLKHDMIDKYVEKGGGEFHIFKGQISPFLKFMTIGPKGSTKQGFDMEFDITVDEGRELFKEIMGVKDSDYEH